MRAGRRFRFFPIVLLVFLVPSGRVVGDTIVLKNGGRIEGSIVSEDDKTVRIRVRYGETEIPRSQILRIERGELTEATYRRRSTALGAGDAQGWAELASWCVENGMRSEGIAAYRKSLAAQPDHPKVRGALLLLLDPEARRRLVRAKRSIRAGDLEKGMEILRVIVQEFPETSMAVECRGLLADSAARRGDLVRAEAMAKEVLRVRPHDRRALSVLERIALDSGRYDEASRLSIRLEDGLGLQIELLRGLAVVLERASTPTEKVDARRESVRILAKLGAWAGVRSHCLAVLTDTDEKGSVSPEPTIFFLNHLIDSWVGSGRIDQGRIVCREASGRADLTEGAKRNFRRRAKSLGAMLRFGEFGLDESEAVRITKLERLLHLYFSAENDKAVPGLLATIEKASEGFSPRLLVAVVARGARWSDKVATGRVLATVRYGTESLEGSYALEVPAEYTPDRAWPLVVELHGAGDSGKRYIEEVAPATRAKGFLLVCPTANPIFGWGMHRHGMDYLRSVVRDVASRYRVDPDRVYLSGVSMGGHGAWNYASLMPGRFGAFASRSGAGHRVLRHGLIDNLTHVPAFVVYGGKDTMVPPKIVRESVEALAGRKIEHKEVYFPERGHLTYMDQNEKILDWFTRHPRLRNPSDLDLRISMIGSWQAYWLRVDEIDPGTRILERKIVDRKSGQVRETLRLTRKPARLVAAVGSGNRIKISVERVVQITVFLTDDLVDLDREVQIVVAGRTRFKERIERSFVQLLERCRQLGDRTRPYWGEVTIRLSGTD